MSIAANLEAENTLKECWRPSNETPKQQSTTIKIRIKEDTDMMLDWNEYRKQLAVGVKEVGQLSPDTIKGYIELSSAGQKTDLLGAKFRELIALAVAVTSRCDGCITVHTEAAIKH